MKLPKPKRPTTKQLIWLIIAAVFTLLVFSTSRPSALLLPIYRSIYMPKTQMAFDEAKSQLGPILSFVDAKPFLKRPLYCYYTAPPRVSYRHFGCNYSVAGERSIVNATQLKELDVWSQNMANLLRTNGWTATIPASIYGGEWHTTSLETAQTRLSQADGWVRYVQLFGNIRCTLNVETRPDRHSSVNGRRIKVDLSCSHIQKLPVPEGI
jgi:hypothetical protein